MTRTRTIALFGALALVGCQNMGLDYANPAQEGAPSALVAAVTAPTASWGGQELIVDGRLWVPWDVVTLREEDLRPVGSADGTTAHARSWDSPPYDALFTRLAAEAGEAGEAAGRAGVAGRAGGDAWLAYAPVIGGGGRDRQGSGEDAGGH